MADTLAASTDFSNATFNKEEVAQAVVQQYDDEKTRLFYRLVMGAPCATACSTQQQRSGERVRCGVGGGGESIHYGIFRSPSDGVREASEASTDFMMTCMDWARPVRRAPRRREPLHVRRVPRRCAALTAAVLVHIAAPPLAQVTAESRVLDLGSGHGGCAHALVQRFGCRVQARPPRRKLSRHLRRAPQRTAPGSAARPVAPDARRAQCLNICPQQNELNRARCVELGIADKVDIALGASAALRRAPSTR